MNIFKQFYNTVKPSVSRFPASIVLSLSGAVLASVWNWNRWSSEAAFLQVRNFAYFTMLAFFLSIFLQLLAEKIFSNEKNLSKEKIVFGVLQVVSVIAVFFPISFAFKNIGNCISTLSWWGLVFALIVGIFYLLIEGHSEEKIVPVILTSFVISSIASLCIGLGLTVVAAAVMELILKGIRSSDDVYLTIWIVTGLFFEMQIFLAYVTKKDFSVTKVYKVIVHYMLFPIYVILLLVLYIYLIQSLVCRTMPHMNWFVSFATACWFVFWFALKPFKNKVTDFFYSKGHFFIYPLFVIQVINFIIRVHAYGFTTARSASLYYIIFSMIFLILPLIKNSRFMSLSLPLLSILLILGSCTPINTIASGVRSQEGRMISILEKYDGLSDFSINRNNLKNLEHEDVIRLSELFSEINFSRIGEDPEYKKLFCIKEFHGVTKNEKNDIDFNGKSFQSYGPQYDFFEEMFGAKYMKTYIPNTEELCYVVLKTPDEGDDCSDSQKQMPVDIEGFKKMYVIGYQDLCEADGKFYIELEDSDDIVKIDLTDFVKSHIRHPDENGVTTEDYICPLRVKSGEYTVQIDGLDARNYYEYEYTLNNDEWNVRCSGYVFK